MVLFQLFLFILLWGAVEGSYCSYGYGYSSYDCKDDPALSWGSIVGIVFGSAIGIAVLVTILSLVVKYSHLCCIRPQAENNRIHATGNPVAFVSIPAGGYVNTATYSPGTQVSYPQSTFPPQQAAPSSGLEPPPPSA